MRFLVVLTLVAYCSAQAYFPYTYGLPWAQQYRTEDAFGLTSFGHHTIDQNRQETRFPDGRVVGRFSYIDPKGKPSVTYYDAGRHGFRVHSNNLPVAPKPVEETAAVAEARAVLREKQDEAVVSRQKRSNHFLTVPVSGDTDETKPSPLVYTSPYHHYAPYAPYSPYSGVVHPFYQPHPYMVPTTPIKEEDSDGNEVPFPLLYTRPTVVDHTFKTHQLEPKDAGTPASTTLLEPTTKEHTVSVPALKYVSPYTPGSPLVYSSAMNPAFMTYGAVNPFYKFVGPLSPKEEPEKGDSK